MIPHPADVRVGQAEHVGAPEVEARGADLLVGLVRPPPRAAALGLRRGDELGDLVGELVQVHGAADVRDEGAVGREQAPAPHLLAQGLQQRLEARGRPPAPGQELPQARRRGVARCLAEELAERGAVRQGDRRAGETRGDHRVVGVGGLLVEQEAVGRAGRIDEEPVRPPREPRVVEAADDRVQGFFERVVGGRADAGDEAPVAVQDGILAVDEQVPVRLEGELDDVDGGAHDGRQDR